MTISKQELQEILTTIGNSTLEFKDEAKERIDDLNQQFKIIAQEVANLKTPKFGGSSTRIEANGNTTTYGDSRSQVNPEHTKAFKSWVRKGSDPDGLKKIEARLSTLSDPDGGYLVPIEIEKNIERLAQSSVAMRRLARIVTSKGEYSKPLSVGGASGGWVAELDSRDETDSPSLTLFSPAMNELYANPSCTQKLLDMSDFDVEGWLSEEIADVFNSKEGAAFINGSGVGQPHGIIDLSKMVANESWTFGKTGFIKSKNATLINNPDALIALQHSLKPVYRSNATWLMNDSTFEIIRKLKDGDGSYLWRPGLESSQPDTLLGRPVEIDENMPDISAGEFPVCFGDFKRAYTIIDHISSVRCLRDPFSKKGWVYFYTTKRLAGGVSNYEALKFLKIAA